MPLRSPYQDASYATAPEAFEYYRVDVCHQAGNEDLVVGRRRGPDHKLGHARHGSIYLRDQHHDVARRVAEQFLSLTGRFK